MFETAINRHGSKRERIPRRKKKEKKKKKKKRDLSWWDIPRVWNIFTIDFNLETAVTVPCVTLGPRHQITVTITLHNNYKRADKHLLYLIVIVDVARGYIHTVDDNISYDYSSLEKSRRNFQSAFFNHQVSFFLSFFPFFFFFTLRIRIHQDEIIQSMRFLC